MNIYEIYVTIVTKKRRGEKIERFTFPHLVAETNAAKAKAKLRRVMIQNMKGKHGAKVSYSKANCIISNR